MGDDESVLVFEVTGNGGGKEGRSGGRHDGFLIHQLLDVTPDSFLDLDSFWNTFLKKV